MDLLLTEDWDLTVDGQGNIATVDQGHAIAQQVANAIKLEKGEGWYDRKQGTPYLTSILGISPNWNLIRDILLEQAERVDGVVQVDMDLYLDDQRVLHGNIYLKSDQGTLFNVQL